MDLEFKTEEEKWEFCAKMHQKLKESYENSNKLVKLTTTEQFRLVRILEEFHYPN